MLCMAAIYFRYCKFVNQLLCNHVQLILTIRPTKVTDCHPASSGHWQRVILLIFSHYVLVQPCVVKSWLNKMNKWMKEWCCKSSRLFCIFYFQTWNSNCFLKVWPQSSTDSSNLSLRSWKSFRWLVVQTSCTGMSFEVRGHLAEWRSHII